MPYLKKTVHLKGKIIIRKYHSGRYGHKGIHNRKINRTPEDVKRINEQNRIRKLYYLLAENFDFGDGHWTLTYPREERPDPETAKKILAKFLASLRAEYRKRGEVLKYIAVTEYEKTAIHHHVIINTIEGTLKLVKGLWKKGTYLSPLYEDGEYENLAAYLVKETGKSGEKKAAYTRSRNLREPRQETEVVKANTFAKTPTPPDGYWIPISSIREGWTATGYPYQEYVCIKSTPPDRGAIIRKSRRDHEKNRKESKHHPRGDAQH